MKKKKKIKLDFVEKYVLENNGTILHLEHDKNTDEYEIQIITKENIEPVKNKAKNSKGAAGSVSAGE